MSAPKPVAGQKRKYPSNPRDAPSNARKREKLQKIRTFHTQNADAAVSGNGELNISSFIRAREFEIKALGKNMKTARRGLSSRAFQQVPRHLRRRTASHNVKKVPRRLRSRARREMVVDNTPVVNSKTRQPTSRLRLRLETAKALQKLNQKRKAVRQKKREAKANAVETDPSKHVAIARVPKLRKNILANPPLATSKFKRRQVHKTWLPTHTWHTKRAHMTRPIEPLWRMALPLSPTEKSYRPTHRTSGSRGCVAWDMSYMSTIGCRGTDSTLEKLLRALSFNGNSWTGQKYIRWKAGSRFASGWTCKHGSNEAFVTIDVLWRSRKQEKHDKPAVAQPADKDIQMVDATPKATHPNTTSQKTKLDRQIMIRVHPSAFHDFWAEVLKVAKLQKPQILVEDLRFEIGSIEITGANSTEALVATITPCNPDEETGKTWQLLSPLSNPSLLPVNTILSFDAQDPRLLSSAEVPKAQRSSTDEETMNTILVDWPCDREPVCSSLFSHRNRYRASKLPSQWALNRRRQTLSPGQVIQPTSQDPSIPVILLAHRVNASSSMQQGSWTLLAPWKCIDVIWRKLLFHPLSSGSKPRFGGLQEKQQIMFERAAPWYPADFPGTGAGRAWERSQAEKRFDRWVRHPPSRRIAWENLDLGLNRRGELGRGWACDWDYLLHDSRPVIKEATASTEHIMKIESDHPQRAELLLTQRQRRAAKAQACTKSVDKETEQRRRNTSSPESEDDIGLRSSDENDFVHLAPTAAIPYIKAGAGVLPPLRPVLVTVKITLLTRGTPKNAARIYQLPAVRATSASQSAVDAVLRETTKQTTTAMHAGPTMPLLGVKASASSNGHDNLDLRSRWLSLDPQQSPSNVLARMKKDRDNHHDMPRKAYSHAPDSLRHINVLPKNAPPQIVEEYGLKPLTEEETTLLLKSEAAIRMEEQKTWETHVPCPNSSDLIGFVTSGGYNLAEGRGTAIGSIWLQRIMDGWKANDNPRFGTPASDHAKQAGIVAKKQQTPVRKYDRERRLCVVRNAGESVGRLALWELCI